MKLIRKKKKLWKRLNIDNINIFKTRVKKFISDS